MQTVDTTHAPDGILFLDTTHVSKRAVRTYIGVDTFTDPDNVTYATFKIHELSVEIDSAMVFQHPSIPHTITINADYWIAPTIGWIVKDSASDGSSWTRKLLNRCTVY